MFVFQSLRFESRRKCEFSVFPHGNAIVSVLFENCEFFINMKGNSFSYKSLTYVIFNEETSFHFLLPGFLARKNSEHALIRQNIRRKPGFVLEFRSSVEK